MDDSLISKWDISYAAFDVDSAKPMIASAKPKDVEEYACGLALTYHLPSEKNLADDGGCAAFLADTIRKPRRN